MRKSDNPEANFQEHHCRMQAEIQQWYRLYLELLELFGGSIEIVCHDNLIGSKQSIHLSNIMSYVMMLL